MAEAVSSSTTDTTIPTDLPPNDLTSLLDQIQQQQMAQAERQVLVALFNQVLNKITSEASE